jgi:hypothetical protein
MINGNLPFVLNDKSHEAQVPQDVNLEERIAFSGAMKMQTEF